MKRKYGIENILGRKTKVRFIAKSKLAKVDTLKFVLFAGEAELNHHSALL